MADPDLESIRAQRLAELRVSTLGVNVLFS